MNILLTGGAGYIGSHVALTLLDQKHEVTIVDSLVTSNSKLIPNKARFIKCDIADKEKISEVLKNKSFDVVMHFAGLTRVGESVNFPDKYFENNYEKAKIFFNTCIKFRLKKIIFSSSGSVYGNVIDKKNILESQTPKPTNPYSESKFKLEKFLIEQSEKKIITATILRYFNVAGADKKMRSGLLNNPDNLIKVVCEVANDKRDKIIINGKDYDTKDGTTIRDFIHVSDIVEMHLLAAKNLIKEDSTEIYNCGYGYGYSIKDIIEETNNILNKKISYEYGPRRKGDAVYSVADNRKFTNKFKWKAKHNLKDILITALEWEKKILKI
jgi:UDP-glucose 4-epimerase|tara:strand:- start:581 stop:1558 length:978 start_codon:yes stop_codon:yes gene_type:complete